MARRVSDALKSTAATAWVGVLASWYLGDEILAGAGVLGEPRRRNRRRPAFGKVGAWSAAAPGIYSAAGGVSALEYRVLGKLEVWRDGQPVDLGAYRQRALLGLLLTSPNAVFSTDRIIDGLWGDDPTDKQNALWVSVSGLRKALDPDRQKRSEGTNLLTRAPGYLLSVDQDATDVMRFERLLAEGRVLTETDPASASEALTGALALWRGRAFEEFFYESFAQDEIARLEGLRVEATEARIDADLNRGMSRELVSELDVLVRQHPLHEGITGQLMLALYRSGRQADALRAYQSLRARLGGEVGVEPSNQIQRLEEQMVTADPGLLLATAGGRHVTGSAPDPAAWHPGIEVSSSRDRLPQRHNEFISRSAIGEVVDVLGTRRLVTILGPGGIGKSRCAVAAVEQARNEQVGDRWTDGVWFVDFAALPEDSPSVSLEVIRTLGLGQQAGLTMNETLIGYLRNRAALLIFDNCEHVLDGVVELVSALLRGTDRVSILATSRVRLDLAGEFEVTLGSMTSPEAARLFRARASEAAAGPFPESDVSALCSMLDNYPLAIELAAGRSRSMGPREIAERLPSRPGLLEAGQARGPARHASLAAALDWSLSQLEPHVLQTLCDATVFAGDFDLAAAEAVLASSDESPSHVVDDLDKLVSHHLVDRDHERGRYRLLEPIRQTVGVDVSSSSDAVGLHVDYYLQQATDAVDGFFGPDEGMWSRRFTDDLPNIRQAVHGAIQRGAAPAIERLMWRMPMVITDRIATEVTDWATATIEAFGVDPRHMPFTAAATAAGRFHMERFAECDELLDALEREADDPAVLCVVYRQRYHGCTVQNDYGDAMEWIHRSEVAAREAGDDLMAMVAKSFALDPSVVADADATGCPSLRAFSRIMAYSGLSGPERRESAHLMVEAHDHAVDSDNPSAIAQTHLLLGAVLCKGDAIGQPGPALAEGAAHMVAGAEILLRMRSPMWVWNTIEIMANVTVEIGHTFEGARLWAAVTRSGYVPAPRVFRDPALTVHMSERLSPDELAVAGKEGSALDMDAAAACAVELFERLAETPG